MSTAAAPLRDPREHASSAASAARKLRAQEAKETQESKRPALYVVRGGVPARSTLPFIVIVLAIVAASLVASMFLNASMAATAFKMQKAQVELNVVTDHIDTLSTEVEKASSSQELAKRAAGLGMVPAGAPGVVDLGTSTASGGQAAKSE